VTEWTNDMAIQQWEAMPRELLEETAHDGDYAKRHLINPVVLRMLGDVHGRRVLDAGCGNGYLSRMLAARGAQVVGIEPGRSLFDFAVDKGREQPQGIRYVQADLCAPPDLGPPFDAAIASMVLSAIPDWTGAMRACVQALKPGGLFVFTINHPCFEQLWPCWRDHGEYRTGPVPRWIRDPRTQRGRLPPHDLELPQPTHQPGLPVDRSRRARAGARGGRRRSRRH
jgi:2-polyprenyl-3-methyl-5-hydroxy-6-metoxy-1,4-benzoquinol methylase